MLSMMKKFGKLRNLAEVKYLCTVDFIRGRVESIFYIRAL